MSTTTNSKDPYTLEISTQTPINTKIYTLKNGLKVYLSVQENEPRIQTMIAVRAGSKNDPTDATGLAHYLEHMMFKGTSKIASLDWEKEKPLLKKISNLYEKHRKANPAERKKIYQVIDSLSTLAAKYVAANEYDKMVASIGAEGTNAFTSLDRTVYVNNIPSNEADRWLQLEAERFSELVLRLFHTELETVYEEYNRAQASDSRRMWKALMKALLPNHPYGTQTTIGTGEHLKMPSMEKIHNFFSTYYVPNNMAIILSGDFDPDEMIKKVAQHWGGMKARKVPVWKAPTVPTANKTQEITVTGTEKARVQLNWKLDGAGSDDALLAELVGGILYNKQAGLMDINLLQTQAIGQRSAAGVWAAMDYSFFMVYAEPRKNQDLELVVKLLQEQLALLKAGDFDDWLLEAVINQKEIQSLKSLETNKGRSFYLLNAFIFEQPWARHQRQFQRMRAFTKKDIVDFANRVLTTEGLVVLFKREGAASEEKGFDKPAITPIELNKKTASEFMQAFEAQQSTSLKAVFLDYDQQIATQTLSKSTDLSYIKNKNNNTFELTYIVEMGKGSDNLWPYALRYLQFLGTKHRSAKELQQEWFKEGLTFETSVREEAMYLTISGLDRSFEKGVALLEEVLREPVEDDEALENMIVDIKKERADRKKDKREILQRAMLGYAYYGKKAPMHFELPEAYLGEMTSNLLAGRTKYLMDYEHEIFYYGSKSMEEVTHVIKETHQMTDAPRALVPSRDYVQLETKENKVVFVPYEGMSQVELLLVSKGTETYDVQEARISRLYNEYFGRGLSSIVFQEIREARALAYSTYVYNASPRKKDKAHYLKAFVGTQADKLQEAAQALISLMDTLPISEIQVDNALQGIIKKLETERITGAEIFWEQREKARLGLTEDPRIEDYAFYKELANDPKRVVALLQKFHEDVVKRRAFTFLVLGDKKKVDLNYLQAFGTVKEMSLEELFGY
ncbi:MAG: M16 family metallopeptidase [Aureispira sp.]